MSAPVKGYVLVSATPPTVRSLSNKNNSAEVLFGLPFRALDLAHFWLGILSTVVDVSGWARISVVANP